MKTDHSDHFENNVAILVDCDNVSPDILEYAQRKAAQFGRIVLRRGYGNHSTLANKWQEALVRLAFAPCLQYQYASGKNTSDMALALDALEALFDERIDTFCIVTSDSDFTCLCRKLRERGATVCIVGEEKTPDALRNACDQFSIWEQEPPLKDEKKSDAPPSSEKQGSPAKGRPLFVVRAVSQLGNETSEGKVSLAELGQYLKRADPAFSPKSYGHTSLLNMLKTYDLLAVSKENGGHWVKPANKSTLAKKAAPDKAQHGTPEQAACPTE
ncbi:MAG: NYN domain-containing protein [Azoarcus sp.]|jgi:uncharacterized protein (TIGR00288 family)|nr:NYN domain-containing protein [Azoarcus sp.]